mmetsp:Transcript_65238/g.201987  ORF Transcript_65238/g.201987 Transcript_65238/m.201987 type:complete len:649 (+) Transcript_65238:51-1997(+)
MAVCGESDHAVNIALSNILCFFDRELLLVSQCVSRPWQRTFRCVNSSQCLFRATCLQHWPWLRDSLSWSHCGHHLWHRYMGNWQLLCRDANRANAVCTLELVVPLDVSEPRGCVQSPWVPFPGRDMKLSIKAYPVGNRRMTTTHLSAYLEVQGQPHKKEWHAALDFTFVMQHPTDKTHEVSWSSGPVRFQERRDGGPMRLDWGCHELLPMAAITREGQAKPSEVLIKSHVALQEALVEVVHVGQLAGHMDDFGLCDFGETFTPWNGAGPPRPGAPVRLMVPASTTKAELLRQVSRALGRHVPRVWRFSRSLEAYGRLTCNLPEAPRHLLASEDEEEEDNAVYALLTKWTLGESSGGSKQNFFRLLAEDLPGPPDGARAPAAPPGGGPTARVFLKLLGPDSGGGLRFGAFAEVPGTQDVRRLLASALRALGGAPQPPGGRWCLVREGSPADWAGDGVPGDPGRACAEELINGSGPVVNGDTLVLCPAAELPRLAALYGRQYRRRVADFVALHAREAAQVGSVPFAALCRAVDRLNVDPWRLEQLAGGAAGPCGSTLALMSSLPGLHPLFFCDACGTRELRGSRFNCLVCSDFDLCSACYHQQPSEDARPKGDDDGRFHRRSHRMVEVSPALPADCLSSCYFRSESPLLG